MTRHIRRTDDLPTFARQELERPRRYQPGFTVVADGLEFVASFRRDRWTPVDFEHDDPEPGTLHRGSFWWITLEGEKVGAFKLTELRLADWEDNEGFLWAMDTLSADSAALATVLCSSWSDLVGDVARWGDIVEFQAAWMHPRFATGGVWGRLVTEALRRRYRARSILVLKAFPLEYEGRVPDASPVRYGLNHRRAAMVRHYGNVMGVRPLPGAAGQEGWLWAESSQAAFVSEPRASC